MILNFKLFDKPIRCQIYIISVSYTHLTLPTT